MSSGKAKMGSVEPVHPEHPILTKPQVMAAHLLAEVPLGLNWKQKAAKIGLSYEQLFRYRQVPEFHELVIQVARANLRAEIPGAYESLVKGLKAGGGAGAKYLELFFKLTGELTDQEHAQNLRGWLDAVADCSSDLLVVAIQRTTGRATGHADPLGSRVVAPATNVAQGGRMELTEHTASGELWDDRQDGGACPVFADREGSLEL